MSTKTMKAIQVHGYGDADQLKLEQIPQPEPEEGEVLVRVYAAGADLAGVVEQVSPGVTVFIDEGATVA